MAQSYANGPRWGSQPRAGLVSQLDKKQAARDSDPLPASIPNPHDRRGRRLPFRSAVSPATRGETTTQAERRRASRWRPEKAVPEDSGEGVPARLGTGEDAHGRSAAPPAARGSPASLVLGVGVTGEVGAGYDAVGSAIREPERRWAPCVSVGAGSPLRPWGQGRWSSTRCAGRSSAGARMPLRQMPIARATDHAAEGGLPPLDADEAPCPWGPRVRPPSFFATRLSLIEETKVKRFKKSTRVPFLFSSRSVRWWISIYTLAVMGDNEFSV